MTAVRRGASHLFPETPEREKKGNVRPFEIGLERRQQKEDTKKQPGSWGIKDRDRRKKRGDVLKP